MTDHGGREMDEQDPEYEEAAPASSAHPEPGDINTESGLAVIPEPVVGSDVSTRLEEDEPEHTIPPGPLWAMKDRRHIQWHLLPAHERHERIHECLEAGDYTLYCIDDGAHHAMIGRRVGDSPSGCEYTLLGRITRKRYEELRDEVVLLANSFDTATEMGLCGVVVEESFLSSNVFDVANYGSIGDVPTDYRPGSPFQHFPQDLEIVA